MSHKFVPANATTIHDGPVVIDFHLYRSDKCQLENICKPGIVKKILRFLMHVGKCKDVSELMDYLRGNNLQDLSKNPAYQQLIPEEKAMKVYEVWHKKGMAERILFSYSGNTFYPVIILSDH